MSTIKIKTPNGYEKVEIPSCLPANVEFGEPEDWTSKEYYKDFVVERDGIVILWAHSSTDSSGNLYVGEKRNDGTYLEFVSTAPIKYHRQSLTCPIRKGKTYQIGFSNVSWISKQVTFYPFKTKPVNDYSTDEICIGKWIDGKPLYRKVIVSETIPTQGTVVVQNADTLVNQYGSMKYIPNDQQFNFPFNDGINQIRLMLNNSSHEIFLVASGDYINYSYVGKAKFVVEYTKQ